MLGPKKMPVHFSEQMYAKQVRLVAFCKCRSLISPEDSQMTTPITDPFKEKCRE